MDSVKHEREYAQAEQVRETSSPFRRPGLDVSFSALSMHIATASNIKESSQAVGIEPTRANTVDFKSTPLTTRARLQQRRTLDHKSKYINILCCWSSLVQRSSCRAPHLGIFFPSPAVRSSPCEAWASAWPKLLYGSGVFTAWYGLLSLKPGTFAELHIALSVNLLKQDGPAPAGIRGKCDCALAFMMELRLGTPSKSWVLVVKV